MFKNKNKSISNWTDLDFVLIIRREKIININYELVFLKNFTVNFITNYFIKLNIRGTWVVQSKR
jgi:hypothetical protein